MPNRGKLFGTDGVRGIANADLTPELALDLGRAFGASLRGNGKEPVVMVARDTRTSGTMLAAAAAAGLCSAGVQVLDAGLLPTPGLHLLAKAHAYAGGVMISASHNPPDFNGIKLFGSAGQKLTPTEERELEALVFAEEDLAPRPGGEAIGTVQVARGASAEYVALLLQELGPLDLGGLKVVLDCAYGAAFATAPEAFRLAGAEATVLHLSLIHI